jgi:hypothetical protein
VSHEFFARKKAGKERHRRRPEIQFLEKLESPCGYNRIRQKPKSITAPVSVFTTGTDGASEYSIRRPSV